MLEKTSLKTSSSSGTNSLFNSFESYYKNPKSRSVKEELYHSILEFDDYQNFREFAKNCNSLKLNFYDPTCFDTEILTNGSTGRPIPYNFSFYRFWQTKIENFIRGNDKLSLFLFDRPFYQPEKIRREKSNIYASLSHHKSQIIKEMQSLNEPFVLTTTPNCWLHISTDSQLRDEINELPIIHGTNTDWEIFGRFDLLKFPVKDQMIDWSTGINFYTCSTGYKHFLPIFYLNNKKSSNLLNLSQIEKTVDDSLEIKEQTICSCGKNRPIFDFQSHPCHHLKIDRDIIFLLEGSYYNFQLIKLNDILYFFRINDNPNVDNIIDKLTSDGYSVKDMPNQFCRVGAKTYNFWNINNSFYSFCNFTDINELKQRKEIPIL